MKRRMLSLQVVVEEYDYPAKLFRALLTEAKDSLAGFGPTPHAAVQDLKAKLLADVIAGGKAP